MGIESGGGADANWSELEPYGDESETSYDASVGDQDPTSGIVPGEVVVGDEIAASYISGVQKGFPIALEGGGSGKAEVHVPTAAGITALRNMLSRAGVPGTDEAGDGDLARMLGLLHGMNAPIPDQGQQDQ